MSTPLHGQISDTYVSDGNARVLQLRFDPDYFALFNQTNFNTSGLTPVTKRAWWFRSLAPGNAFTVKNTASANTDESNFVATNGFNLVNSITDPVGPLSILGAAVTAANPAVVSSAGHSVIVGDVVRMIDVTGMQQISSMEFTVTAVTPAIDFTLGFLDSSTFVAGVANFHRIIPFDPRDFAPKNRYITAISNAANASVQLSVDHEYNVGEVIGFRCTPDFGMSEIDGLTGEILQVGLGNNVIVDINTTAFTPFAFPTSATAAAGVTFPQTVPVGDTGNVLSGAIDNQGLIGLRLGTDVVGAPGDVVHWVATKGLFGV